MSDTTIFVKSEPRVASELIEVVVDTNGRQRVQFPDVPQLRNQPDQIIIIKKIRVISAKVLTHGVITGNTNAPLSELKKMTVVIYSEGWEKGHYIPVLLLNDVNDSDATAATTIPFRNDTTVFSNWKNVDWKKTYLQYANTQVSAGAPYTVIFEVEYIKINSKGFELVGPQ